jgi:hypothetical protein
VQIAQQLQSVYGDDVPRAINDSEARAMRFNNVLKAHRRCLHQLPERKAPEEGFTPPEAFPDEDTTAKSVSCLYYSNRVQL